MREGEEARPRSIYSSPIYLRIFSATSIFCRRRFSTTMDILRYWYRRPRYGAVCPILGNITTSSFSPCNDSHFTFMFGKLWAGGFFASISLLQPWRLGCSSQCRLRCAPLALLPSTRSELPNPPMGAAESTASKGGLVIAHDLYLQQLDQAENSDGKVSEMMVDTLVKKLGAGISLSRGELLHFTCRGLTDADMTALALLANLQETRCEMITSINLSHNMIGDAGASALGRALSGGAPALRKLWLHENKIRSAGLTGLAAAFRADGAPGITELRLQFNDIDDVGVLALAEAWEAGGCSQLREVHLGANQIGDAGLAALAQHLHAVPSLQTLAMGSSNSGNLVGDDGAMALATALAARVPREEPPLAICLKNNKLTPTACEQLQASATKGVKLIFTHAVTKTPSAATTPFSTTPSGSRESTPLSTPSRAKASTSEPPSMQKPASPYEA